MKVVIIEDEPLTAEDLASILIRLPYNVEVLKILFSVEESVHYFNTGAKPDVIFCDIELGDGHSFEIFKKISISTPVIFCTAYNRYALDAFKNNGVGYILKPFTKRSIKEAVDKFRALRKEMLPASYDLTFLLSGIQQSPSQEKSPASLLVNWKDKIIPVKYSDIALFGIAYKSSFLVTFQNERFPVAHSLDDLELTCGSNFYRANRQYLINRNAVAEALQYSARKLFIRLKINGDFNVTIAKAKVPEFLSWLRN